MDQIRRHMTFYHIALHYCGVTRIQLLGYVVFDFDVDQLLASDVFLFDSKTVRLQVPDPRRTAPSAGILIDRYRCDGRFRLRIARGAAHEHEYDGEAAAQKVF
jgi:hypothetical protein